MRGLQARLEGRRSLRARGAPARPALAVAGRPGGAADRRAGGRVPPAGEIHPHAAGRRRQRAAASGHVRPHADRPGGRPTRRPLHEHLTLETDDGWRVGFVDPRRFGCVDLVATAAEDSHRLLAGLGPEPLERRVHRRRCCRRRWPGGARRSRRRCWTRAWWRGWAISMCARRCSAPRISPRRLAHSVAGARAARLVPAIKATLAEAIAAGGSSAARLRAAGRRAGLFPARLEGLRPRRRACERCPGPPGCAGVSASCSPAAARSIARARSASLETRRAPAERRRRRMETRCQR